MNNLLKYIFAFGTFLSIGVAGYVFIVGRPSDNDDDNSKRISCTMEAKLCSDGSAVGRTGPACAFAPCPKENLIKVASPHAFAEVTSPLLIKGSARGTWYFEASFPIKLYDEHGTLIAQHYATAQSDWMTTEFVPFESTLEFSISSSQQGTLVLEKDNPSGLPEHADEIRIPVMLTPSSDGLK